MVCNWSVFPKGNLCEPHHEKTCLRESPTKQDTNWPAKLQRLSRILKFRLYKLKVSLSWQRTTKALIRLRGCTGRSAPLLFAYGIRHIFSWPGSFDLGKPKFWEGWTGRSFSANPCFSKPSYKWATSWENLFMPYANNKGADQPAHLRSLISAFVVRCLDSIIPLLAIAETGAKLDTKLREKWLLPPVGTGRSDSQEGRSGSAWLHFSFSFKEKMLFCILTLN